MTTSPRLRLTAACLLLAIGLRAADAPPAQPPLPPPVTFPGFPVAPEAVAAPSGGGTITFASLEYDFGRIPMGQIVKTEFVFTNTGTTTLEILNVKPGCGCTTTWNWDRKVEPGQTGTIPVQFNSANFSGRVSKPITVASTDPARPTLQLRIAGDIWRPIELQPNFVYFPSLDPDVPVTKVVKLINNTDEFLKVTDLQSSNSMYRVEMKEVKPGKEFEIQITTVPPLEGANPQTTITAKTSSTNMPDIRLTAMAMVYAPVTALPGTVMLPSGPLTGTTSYVINVKNNRPSLPMTVTGATCNLTNVTVKVTEQTPNLIYNVEVVFPQGYQMQPGQMGQVSITTTHPKVTNLSVNVVQLTNGARPPRVPGATAAQAAAPAPAPAFVRPAATNGAPIP